VAGAGAGPADCAQAEWKSTPKKRREIITQAPDLELDPIIIIVGGCKDANNFKNYYLFYQISARIKIMNRSRFKTGFACVRSRSRRCSYLCEFNNSLIHPVYMDDVEFTGLRLIWILNSSPNALIRHVLVGVQGPVN
jgi:hypothetical protein